MAHFNNFGCYLIEVNLDDQSLFRLVLALASGISPSLGSLVTFRQHELHLLMHFSTHLHSILTHKCGSRKNATVETYLNLPSFC